MATDEALAYLVALSVPLWLLVEHAVVWLRSRRPRREGTAEAAQALRVVRPGAPEATRRAA